MSNINRQSRLILSIIQLALGVSTLALNGSSQRTVVALKEGIGESLVTLCQSPYSIHECAAMAHLSHEKIHALVASPIFGLTAAQEIAYFSYHLAGRSVGSKQEQAAITYLIARLESFGYRPARQSFSFEYDGETFTSVNITAQRNGNSGRQILIGAHYDTALSDDRDRSTLEGTNDNASGVGVLLELAQQLEAETTHTIKFILFGAEEADLAGSRHYADNMTEAEIRSTLVMVNLDGLIIGDHLYFQAGRQAIDDPNRGFYRDLALGIASELGIDAKTNPGLNPQYPAGTGCCSDQESFDGLLPILAVEATNWRIGDLDGYTQTSNPNVPGGQTWHDPTTDNLAFIQATFPGLITERCAEYTQILDTFIDRVNAGEIAPGSAG